MTEPVNVRMTHVTEHETASVSRERHVIVPEAAIEIMKDDARRGYPDEVCGILVGRADGDERVIERVIPVENARQDERARRYVIEADVLRRVEREATDSGIDVIGFYHSHPDHPAVPSAFDREHSWPWYTYIILSVRSGAVVDTRAWQLSDDRTHFAEAGVIVPAQPQKPAPETRQ